MKYSKTFIHYQLQAKTKCQYFTKSKLPQVHIVNFFYMKTQRFKQSSQDYLEVEYMITDNIYQYLNVNSLKLNFTPFYFQTQNLCKKKLLKWAYIRSVFVNKGSQYHLQKTVYRKKFKVYFKRNKLLLYYIKYKWKNYLKTLFINNYSIKITKT